MADTVVVLGASGLLGQALLKALAQRGRPAAGLSRRTGVDLAALSSPQALAQALKPHAPALVINAAALTSLDYCEQHADEACALHVRLPALLSAWSRGTGVPWVQVSTDHYFCGPENRLHDEYAPVLLLNQYARSKHAGEDIALQSPQALVLRTNIVGWRGWPGQPSLAEWAVAALQAGQPFAGYTDCWASSMEAGQCATALLDLADRGARGLLNVASRDSISKAEFITRLAQALDLSSTPLLRQPRPSGGLPRANALGLNVQRAEHLLGRALPTATQVAQAVATAFREHHHVAA
jgi:dTDP-4-dehydrorhamnose reductase